jgi:hypothetical protein
MTRPDFEDLPFDERPDLTPYLIHLTKNTKPKDDYSAFDNLVSILQTGEVRGSESRSGFIKGPNSATCFMDVPFISLKYILNRENSDPTDPRYEPFGVVVHKKYAYHKGCRPVLYLSNNEMKQLQVPEDEQWRVVRFEVSDEGWISWLHEREWRCKGNFQLPSTPLAVLVKNTHFTRKLQETMSKNPKEFKAIPKSIMPLTLVCQGLPYL